MPEHEQTTIVIPVGQLERRPRIVQIEQAINGYHLPELRMPKGFVQQPTLEMRPRVITYQEELQQNKNN